MTDKRRDFLLKMNIPADNIQRSIAWHLQVKFWIVEQIIIIYSLISSIREFKNC